MNWCGNIEEEIKILNEREMGLLEAYCAGVNSVFARKYPWEFKLMGYKPEPWEKEDCIMISRMIGYITLSQSQWEIERLFLEMVQAGISKEMLDELFPGILGELDIDLIKKVKLNERIVPPDLLWNNALPRMMASNNWVVSGSKTSSGKPILANDPHLEINRLPNVWHEMVLLQEERYAIGTSMPGTPGIIIGRTPDLAWGVTYSFTDSVDSWIEDCKDGKYRRGTSWIDFRRRKEIIKRKKKEDIEIIYYENDHGVLDGNPYEDGYYLSTNWSAAKAGPKSLKQFFKVWDAKTVEEGMDAIGQMEYFFSWVFADKDGNIGFQMSGLTPKRREGISGFVPLPGWDEKNDWQGFVDHAELPRVINPEKGYFATANQDLNAFGNVKPINMPMGSYRADRISSLLEKGNNFTVDDMCKIQQDVYSIQAEIFMKILKPLLPNSSQANIFKNWDYNYSPDSKGAFLFEEFYKALFQKVFGKNGFGRDIISFLNNETGIFIDFYKNFDQILLKEKSLWFAGRSRDDIFKQAAEEALKIKPKALGKTRKVMLSNILFGGKLPAFLGFDRGPITIVGGRASICQGQIYNSAGRLTTFCPSIRIVTDMGKDETITSIAGGPSDRRFSKWYCSDLKNHLTGKYKTLKPVPEKQIRF
jgi:penicillin amidase